MRDTDDLIGRVCAGQPTRPNIRPPQGLVNEPPIANAVTTRPSSVDEKRREALYPSVDGDMVDFGASFGQEFFDVSVGKSVAQIPTHRQQDHLRREPIARKCRPIERWRNDTTVAHPHSLADRARDPWTQQCRFGHRWSVPSKCR
jgi:hypothetical protein